jgi:hypothetical protein
MTTGDLGSKWSIRSEDSLLCIGCKGSVLSIGSIGSVLSIGSLGSAASLFSIGSAASVASILSFWSRRAVMRSGIGTPLTGVQGRLRRARILAAD